MNLFTPGWYKRPEVYCSVLALALSLAISQSLVVQGTLAFKIVSYLVALLGGLGVTSSFRTAAMAHQTANPAQAEQIKKLTEELEAMRKEKVEGG